MLRRKRRRKKGRRKEEEEGRGKFREMYVPQNREHCYKKQLESLNQIASPDSPPPSHKQLSKIDPQLYIFIKTSFAHKNIFIDSVAWSSGLQSK